MGAIRRGSPLAPALIGRGQMIVPQTGALYMPVPVGAPVPGDAASFTVAAPAGAAWPALAQAVTMRIEAPWGVVEVSASLASTGVVTCSGLAAALAPLLISQTAGFTIAATLLRAGVARAARIRGSIFGVSQLVLSLGASALPAIGANMLAGEELIFDAGGDPAPFTLLRGLAVRGGRAGEKRLSAASLGAILDGVLGGGGAFSARRDETTAALDFALSAGAYALDLSVALPAQSAYVQIGVGIAAADALAVVHIRDHTGATIEQTGALTGYAPPRVESIKILDGAIRQPETDILASGIVICCTVRAEESGVVSIVVSDAAPLRIYAASALSLAQIRTLVAAQPAPDRVPLDAGTLPALLAGRTEGDLVDIDLSGVATVAAGDTLTLSAPVGLPGMLIAANRLTGRIPAAGLKSVSMTAANARAVIAPVMAAPTFAAITPSATQIRATNSTPFSRGGQGVTWVAAGATQAAALAAMDAGTPVATTIATAGGAPITPAADGALSADFRATQAALANDATAWDSFVALARDAAPSDLMGAQRTTTVTAGITPATPALGDRTFTKASAGAANLDIGIFFDGASGYARRLIRGETYTVTGRATLTGGALNRLRFRWQNATGVLAGGEFVRPATGGWANGVENAFEVTFTVPADAPVGELRLRVAVMDGASTGSFTIDAITGRFARPAAVDALIVGAAIVPDHVVAANDVLDLPIGATALTGGAEVTTLEGAAVSRPERGVFVERDSPATAATNAIAFAPGETIRCRTGSATGTVTGSATVAQATGSTATALWLSGDSGTWTAGQFVTGDTSGAVRLLRAPPPGGRVVDARSGDWNGLRHVYASGAQVHVSALGALLFCPVNAFDDLDPGESRIQEIAYGITGDVGSPRRLRVRVDASEAVGRDLARGRALSDAMSLLETVAADTVVIVDVTVAGSGTVVATLGGAVSRTLTGSGRHTVRLRPTSSAATITFARTGTAELAGVRVRRMVTTGAVAPVRRLTATPVSGGTTVLDWSTLPVGGLPDAAGMTVDTGTFTYAGGGGYAAQRVRTTPSGISTANANEANWFLDRVRATGHRSAHAALGFQRILADGLTFTGPCADGQDQQRPVIQVLRANAGDPLLPSTAVMWLNNLRVDFNLTDAGSPDRGARNFEVIDGDYARLDDPAWATLGERIVGLDWTVDDAGECAGGDMKCPGAFANLSLGDAHRKMRSWYGAVMGRHLRETALSRQVESATPKPFNLSANRGMHIWEQVDVLAAGGVVTRGRGALPTSAGLSAFGQIASPAAAIAAFYPLRLPDLAQVNATEWVVERQAGGSGPFAPVPGLSLGVDDAHGGLRRTIAGVAAGDVLRVTPRWGATAGTPVTVTLT